MKRLGQVLLLVGWLLSGMISGCTVQPPVVERESEGPMRGAESDRWTLIVETDRIVLRVRGAGRSWQLAAPLPTFLRAGSRNQDTTGLPPSRSEQKTTDLLFTLSLTSP